MRKNAGIIILLMIVLFGSCQSTGTTGEREGFSSKLQNLVETAVFEVVIKKPEEKNIVYDKELDWSVIPYAIRSDNYYSIGTAFAVSSTEAVTAFHVVNLGEESEVFTEYFIRDKQGNVYELDSVHKASNEKDFLVFTVKNKTFSSWFEFNPDFKVNSQVYSIGNALGEGIVVRNGLLLGTVPEAEEGRWNQLKSSADGNPGNSGGPLVTSDGKVVGLVIALRDNILYSLPASEIMSAPSNTTHFRWKSTYGHLLLSNLVTKVFETDVALPAGYKELRSTIYSTYKAFYPSAMEALFEEAPSYLEGPNNRYLLSQTASMDYPEIAYIDKNDDQWKISDLRAQSYDLGDDGLLIQTEISGMIVAKMRRPKSMDPEKINTDPKTIMDTYLLGVSMDRTLGNTGKYRVLSLGDPERVGEYRDSQGRTWIKTYWLLNFADTVMLAYILPMPNGPVMVMTRQNSSRRHVYEWDMEAVCDRVFAGYRGNMEEWDAFLSMDKWIPSSLESFSFDWNEDEKTVSLTLPQLSLKADDTVFDWTSQSSLSMVPGYYLKNNSLEYGFRSLIVERDIKGNDYFLIYQHVKPDERFGAKSMETWNEIVGAKYPFDGQSRLSEKDNTGSAGGLLMQPNVADDVRYSFYISMENPGGVEALSRRFKTLEDSVSIIR
jgi:hypothetical protein